MSSKEIDNKNNVGRPFKMMAWCDALSEVLEEPLAVFLSDKDLVVLVNQKLQPDNQIDKRTFENWKSGKFAPNEDVGKEFIKLIELALIKQKLSLGKKLFEDDTKQWSKYKWILETKFKDWKKINENVNRNEHEIVINITAGNDEQKQLIESIMFADYKIIEPIQLPAKKEINSTYNEIEDEDEF